jgi:hypothetical protein
MDRCVAARQAHPRANLRQLAAQLNLNFMAVKRVLLAERLAA